MLGIESVRREGFDNGTLSSMVAQIYSLNIFQKKKAGTCVLGVMREYPTSHLLCLTG